jgi:SPFH domain / Band 7 family
VNGNYPIHRRLLAEDLIRLRRSDEHRRYAAAQRRGRIDPNPHQIDAVVFALRRIPEMEAYGVRVSVIALKDIILPGDIRDILNQVVTAEKQAQANLIRRREETAATRSLLNTAKLMEGNPLLVRLKELETLEKIADKVEKITVVGGLNALLERTVTLRAE